MSRQFQLLPFGKGSKQFFGGYNEKSFGFDGDRDPALDDFFLQVVTQIILHLYAIAYRCRINTKLALE
ncbi:MAG: hypothetical protein A3C85_03255 [Candidatus Doudnabacteria bacterium RIFCSPHIGHO2_02_FULL_48_21]|uniref:Uncharacterized protein n=1 Tax=Candidatus Doudnabacteria bacterium RIFCSPLOWO2_02_FULL_48_13 TaxID=1817845 RepID=A0A1F5QAW3_9BACT|nr:MAG: hypothetical protein A3K05_03865 [Candidatus Doudnabacteria bacterium RIFCSPHIGHO2_01_48_18]OGE77205.1 MAG: hypothetical protein A2668_01755 [Candidatus Doudnabacteria bacterium RIFCSPHIGHO2_01_FULL_48_180]OGE91415.1 MAG: hypothetical protein A3F44_00655 [Candidatus Doudnabacteria bacterium RIFCSPHIGHO2_12_FULL_47_25]OGE93263.1 MAG: hypothetical protein A3C85_03255 [Candidatus Doudnabacteria bacterium RIFCSPHIGHO2_02_FULL_48_21]OGE96794.1 MAG: hypothetical protein A3A83_01990 [Candidatu